MFIFLFFGLNFIWVFFKNIGSTVVKLMWIYSSTDKIGSLLFLLSVSICPSFPLLCVPFWLLLFSLSSFLLHWLSFLSYTLFFYIRVTFDPNKRQCAAKSGTGAPPVPPTLSVPSNPAPKTLSKSVHFLPYSIPPPDPSSSSSSPYSKYGFYKSYLATAYSL